MTETLTWLLLLTLTLIGGIGTHVKARSVTEAARKKIWIKFIAYAAVVYFILTATLFFYPSLVFIFAVLALAGLFEVYEASQLILVRSIRELCIGIYFLTLFFFISWLNFAHRDEFLALFAVTVIFDGFCQVMGQLFGRTKLTPSISPNKTLEGLLLGGLIVFFAGIYFTSLSPLRVVALCASALFGDLLASAYKRRCGIKDFSDLIPGHGGILDRFDSFFMVGAVSYFF